MAVQHSAFQKPIKFVAAKDMMERVQNCKMTDAKCAELYSKKVKFASSREKMSATLVEHSMFVFNKAFMHPTILKAVQDPEGSL